jgi:ABC-type sugar transport system ATPase subunit
VRGDLAIGLDKVAWQGSLAEGRAVVVGVRPHDVEIVQGADGAPLEVSIVEALGAASYVHGTVAGQPFVARLDPSQRVARGDTVRMAPRNVHLFDSEVGVSLRAVS